MIFFRHYRIDRLKRKQEILLAALTETKRTERIAQTCMHYELVSLARELAALQYDLRKLQEAA